MNARICESSGETLGCGDPEMVGDPDDLHPFLDTGGNDGSVVLLLRIISGMLSVTRVICVGVYLQRDPVKSRSRRLANSLANPGGHGAMPEQGRKLWVGRIGATGGHGGILPPAVAPQQTVYSVQAQKPRKTGDKPCGDIKHGRRSRTLRVTS